MKNLSLIFLLCISTFGFAQTEVAKTPQIVFKIELGATVTSDGIKIQFEEVLEDSRCPLDVQCVWAGQARVKVTISGPEMPEETLELIVGKKEKNVLCVKGEYVLKAMNLAPYPDTTKTESKKYVLLILKEKSN
jgi:hypothetical protein